MIDDDEETVEVLCWTQAGYDTAKIYILYSLWSIAMRPLTVRDPEAGPGGPGGPGGPWTPKLNPESEPEITQNI